MSSGDRLGFPVARASGLRSESEARRCRVRRRPERLKSQWWAMSSGGRLGFPVARASGLRRAGQARRWVRWESAAGTVDGAKEVRVNG